jgi:hypothetical protein
MLAEYTIFLYDWKGSVIPDHLANNAIDDYEPLQFKFPNKDIIIIKNKEKIGEDV